ncbi:hypothetical protein [Micromonospora orduensis]|uniref:hypothetical protein n=1 Tax=Micromonospora orduensis TaxID=1420891 RepID=UPI00362A4D4B
MQQQGLPGEDRAGEQGDRQERAGPPGQRRASARQEPEQRGTSGSAENGADQRGGTEPVRRCRLDPYPRQVVALVEVDGLAAAPGLPTVAGFARSTTQILPAVRRGVAVERLREYAAGGTVVVESDRRRSEVGSGQDDAVTVAAREGRAHRLGAGKQFADRALRLIGAERGDATAPVPRTEAQAGRSQQYRAEQAHRDLSQPASHHRPP